MSEEVYRIRLEYVPANGNGGTELPAGWLGGKSTGRNDPIYCRVADRSRAWTFNRTTTIDRVITFRKLGYPCHAEPPITETY